MTQDDRRWIFQLVYRVAMTIVIACGGRAMYVREDETDAKKEFFPDGIEVWGVGGVWSPRFPVTEQTTGSNPVHPANL